MPHPEQPDSELPNYSSEVVERQDGAQVWFDVKDEAERPGMMELIVGQVVAGLESAGVAEATLTNKRALREPWDF